jgi:hypothetical protein
MSTVHRPIDQISTKPSRVIPQRTATQETAGERREHLRRVSGYCVRLMSLDGVEVINGTADDLGEGGLHLTAPIGYGFAVGQRYEVLVGDAGADEHGPNMVGEGHYATVVRTRFLNDGTSDQVGIGLRFDHPVVL